MSERQDEQFDEKYFDNKYCLRCEKSGMEKTIKIPVLVDGEYMAAQFCKACVEEFIANGAFGTTTDKEDVKEIEQKMSIVGAGEKILAAGRIARRVARRKNKIHGLKLDKMGIDVNGYFDV